MTYRTSVSKEKWEKLEGTFSLPAMPDRVVFYFEGPSPGVDILIESVVITCSSPSECEVIILFDLFSSVYFQSKDFGES